MRLGGVDPLLLPAPTQVLEALWEDRSLLAPDLWTTTYEVVLGLAAAVLAGARARASRCTSPPPCAGALRPLVIGSQAVPVPVIAPLVILVLGFGLAPKVLLVALVCFFPITINLYDGLRGADPDARRLLRSLQATRWQALRLVEAPAALPAAFTGLKVAAAVAVIGAVFAEWAGAERRPRPRAADRQRAARDRPRVRRHAPALPAGHRPLRRLRAARAAGGRLDSHAPNPEDHDPTLALARAPARSAPRCSPRCGEKSEPDTGAAAGGGAAAAAPAHARLLPERRPRRHLRGAGGRRLREGRAST